MNIAGRDKGMNTPLGCWRDGLSASFDVTTRSTGQTTDCGALLAATCWAMRCTAAKSPGLAKGKPASMTSTPRRASCCAIANFSSRLRLAPGDCSPSRRVVSKINTRPGSLAMAKASKGFSRNDYELFHSKRDGLYERTASGRNTGTFT